MKQAKAPRTLTLVERKAFRDAYRGKLLLDEANAQWPLAVRADLLNMRRPYGQCGCILSQWMYDPNRDAAPGREGGYHGGGYYEGLAELGIADEYAKSCHYGFTTDAASYPRQRGHHATFDTLQRAWTYILRLLGR